MPLDLPQLAHRVGAYRWIEHALFEHLGARATGDGDATERVVLGGFAHQHAWHASLWADRFPLLPGLDLDAATVPTPGGAAVIDVVRTADGPPAAVFRVVVPRLLEAYDRHLAGTDAGTDGPTARALLLCRRDLADEWLTGERLVAATLTSTDVIEAAADQVRRAESALLAAGGLFADD